MQTQNNEFDGFIVEGFLVGGDAATVQVVMPPYLLEIDRADVRHIEERPALPLQNTDTCVAVRLRLCRGARLRGMQSAQELDASMWASRRPFAMVTRPVEAPMVGEAAYSEKERRFFASLGLGE
jgi:hypothetical protein